MRNTLLVVGGIFFIIVGIPILMNLSGSGNWMGTHDSIIMAIFAFWLDFVGSFSPTGTGASNGFNDGRF